MAKTSTTCRVLHESRGDQHHQQQTPGVGSDVPLAVLALLAGVDSLPGLTDVAGGLTLCAPMIAAAGLPLGVVVTDRLVRRADSHAEARRAPCDDQLRDRCSDMDRS